MHWTEHEGVVYFTVTSDGTDVDGWIKRLDASGFNVRAQEALRKHGFVPTHGVNYEIAIMRHSHYFEGDNYYETVRKKAKLLDFRTPTTEIAFLLRAHLSDQDLHNMGFNTVVVVHDPVRGSSNHPNSLYFLEASRTHDEGRVLWLHGISASGRFVGPDGYAFITRRWNIGDRSGEERDDQVIPDTAMHRKTQGSEMGLFRSIRALLHDCNKNAVDETEKHHSLRHYRCAVCGRSWADPK
jgi:hypothetical protein